MIKISKFKVVALDLCWVCVDEDDPGDLCSHGRLRVCPDDIVLEDDCCTSAAAMRMLRTLTENHVLDGAACGA